PVLPLALPHAVAAERTVSARMEPVHVPSSIAARACNLLAQLERARRHTINTTLRTGAPSAGRPSRHESISRPAPGGPLRVDVASHVPGGCSRTAARTGGSPDRKR